MKVLQVWEWNFESIMGLGMEVSPRCVFGSIMALQHTGFGMEVQTRCGFGSGSVKREGVAGAL